MKEHLNEQVQKYISSAYVSPAKKRGQNTIIVKAGDVHRELHWTNRVPSVCTTLGSRKFQRETGLELIAKEGPPSGMGTRATFTYKIVQGGPQSSDSPRRSLMDELYGAASNVFRDLGGAENFIRREREQLHFVEPESKAEGQRK